ncbi:MAG TPA: type II toxin-antitoxin system VapC family toxin [Terriglobales bacterium]|jgi:predicted nucleic-acid-binding protein|nr:type II toxin-antitoxin system VapC family toxin [Terriglobales bacterium]
MIGLDTNVLVRYLVQDDAEQSAAAESLLKTFTAEAPGFISAVSIIELVWVLQSCYEAGRHDIRAVMEDLLRTRELVVERAELIWQSLRIFTQGKADFADCVIERCGHAAGCDYTITFDRDAATSAGMKLLR